MNLKSNDKVIHNYLGPGKVVRSLEKYCKGLWLIRFDQDPPYEYNMSLNPTVVMDESLNLKDKK